MANFTELLRELEQERSRLDQAIRVIGDLVAGAAETRTERPRRTVSAAARRKMAAAQRARWAKAKGATPSTSTPVRTMSRAARNKIAAAQRARWAKTRAQQKKAA